MVGVFLEGCSDKEAEAAKCVAELRPAAPDNWREVLRNQGLDFAFKVIKNVAKLRNLRRLQIPLLQS